MHNIDDCRGDKMKTVAAVDAVAASEVYLKAEDDASSFFFFPSTLDIRSIHGFFRQGEMSE